jgi:osmoprotectant transport system permease protein
VRALTIAALGLALVAAAPNRRVVVASKPFGESYLLSEMFAQLLEARGLEVERRPGLGATEIAFAALRDGRIDVYPEYTGTGLLAILGESPRGSPQEVYARVCGEFGRRWGVRWLPPLGFENTYAIAVRADTARRLGLRTLSDLARHGRDLRGGFTADFLGRADGLAGLERAYGLRLASSSPLSPALKYKALRSGAVDVIDGYSTDGPLSTGALVVLEDDRHFFPPYQAAALVAPRLQKEEPRALAALTELSDRLEVAAMRRFNEQVEVQGQPVASVARRALTELGLVGTAEVGQGGSGDAGSGQGLVSYLWGERAAILRYTARHLWLVGIALLAAIAVAVPLGLALERLRRGSEAALRVLGLLQTIPSIALLAFMLPWLGIGVVPALVALFLYAIYPIARNTYAGVRGADPSAVEAARALGMTPRQVLVQVRLPLAAPIIMTGVRTAAVITVGTATLAAFIGAGGLGEPIVSGLALDDLRQVLAGALPAAALALGVDGLFALCQRALAPRGLGP